MITHHEDFYSLSSEEKKRIIGYVEGGSCRTCKHQEGFYCNKFKIYVEPTGACYYFYNGK